jgi:gas vesicle protein
MKSFLAGLAIGIGLGVLFAPTRGEQTRENIKRRAGKLADTAKERAGELADATRETFEQGRERVRSGIGANRQRAAAAATETIRPTGTGTN